MSTLSFAAVLALIAAGWPLAASAASNRAWVSGHGVDTAGCGAPTSPCRSLQYAHDNAINPGGEIDILDPAGYGAITITKAVSIVNDGVGTAGVQATSGTAIAVNAGPFDEVYLRGLNIDGVSLSGQTGVEFTSGRALTITGCVIRHFQTGILLDPAAGLASFLISDSVSSNNNNGLFINAPSGSATMSGQVVRLTATRNNNDGVRVTDHIGAGSINLAVTDLVSSGNGGNGVTVDASSVANVVVSLDNAQLNLNGHEGLQVFNLAMAHLSRSVLNQNTDFGLENVTMGGGAVFSLGDNEARGNLNNNIFGGVNLQPLF